MIIIYLNVWIQLSFKHDAYHKLIKRQTSILFKKLNKLINGININKAIVPNDIFQRKAFACSSSLPCICIHCY